MTNTHVHSAGGTGEQSVIRVCHRDEGVVHERGVGGQRTLYDLGVSSLGCRPPGKWQSLANFAPKSCSKMSKNGQNCHVLISTRLYRQYGQSQGSS